MHPYYIMKLIRLVTRDTEAVFDNIFSDELMLKRDGKIALQNVAIQLAPFEFKVDDNNKIIKYQNTEIGVVEVALDELTYGEDNYTLLFSDIQTKLNQSCQWDYTNNRILGVEWKCEIPPDDSRVVIEYKRGDLIKDDRYSVLNETQSGTLGDDRLYLTDNAAPSNAGYNYNRTSKKFLARGCSYTRAHIWALNNAGGGAPTGINFNGMILALTTKDLTDADPDEIIQADITYGLWATINATGVRQYYYYLNGVRTFINTATPTYVGDGDAGNDDFEIVLNEGVIQYNIVRANGTRDLVFAADYTPGTRLWPMEIWHGGDQELGVGTPNAIFSDIAYITSPYDEYEPSPLLGLGAEIEVPDTAPFNNFLEFDSDELADYLGYARKRYPQTGFNLVSEATYKADYAFTVFEKSDACLVEMQNIPLDSYDAFQGQRKNILAVVPKSDATGEIIYEPSTPFFIDIHNESDLLLRNIRARIVRTDYRTLKTRGLTTLTILVSD